ncbi:MAG: hypothetical protein ACKVRN_06700 [Pyrinomonadaceae bacterium]
MRIWSIVPIIFAVLLSACGERLPATPLETFKTYTKAIKKKDADTMKLLLSEATIKMHEREATAQNVTLNEILERDTLFNPNQKSVEYREEKIDGDKATLQVKNSFGSWETLPFVREEGVWKIDKLGQANQLIKEHIEKQNQAFGIEKQNQAFGEEMPESTSEPELLPQE